MPANFESGFSVREPMWHGLGTVVQDFPETLEEAIELAGLDFEVVRTPVFAVKEYHRCDSQEMSGCEQPAVAVVEHSGRTLYACATHANRAASKGLKVEALPMRQVPEFLSVVKDDDGSILHVGPATRGIVQPRKVFELTEMLLDAKVRAKGGDGLPEVKLATAGGLDGYRKIWVLAYVDREFHVPGDSSPIYPFLSVMDSYDGSMSLTAILTSVRIVCYNTMSAAENEAMKSGHIFRWRHTASIEDRIEEARATLKGAISETEQWVKYATKMVAIPFSDAQLDKFLHEFIPDPPLATDRVMDNVREARAAVKNIYHSASTVSIAGTAWGAISAVGEYLDHKRTWRSRESYVGRTLLRPEPGKTKALHLIEDMLGVNGRELIES